MMDDATNGPIIYFDTTVLLDAVDDRNESTRQLLEIVRDQRLEVLASPFGILEMLEPRKPTDGRKICLSVDTRLFR